MKHIFIMNPAAGKGDAAGSLLEKVRRFAKESGIDHEIHRSLGKQEIHDYIVKRVDCGEDIRFYACGGDGTINDVLCGIMGHDNAQLAVIPCGSGNDFVRNFTNRAKFFDLQAQLDGSVMPVDGIGMDDGGYALNMINIGVDCDIVIKVEDEKKRGSKGAKGYLKGALQVLPHYNAYRMRYELNGELIEEDVILTAIANGMTCGGGFKSNPTARIDDGLMDVGIIKPVRGLKLMNMLIQYHQGTHLKSKATREYVTYFQCSSFTLEPLSEPSASIDGEVIPFKKTRFEILPRAVKFVVPKGCGLVAKSDEKKETV